MSNGQNLFIISAAKKHPATILLSCQPAALAAITSNTISIYGDRKLDLKALTRFNAAGAIITNSGNFSLSLDYFGYTAFNQSSVKVIYARPLASNISVGVQFNYYSINAGEYGKASAIGFTAATKFILSNKVSVGVSIEDPITSRFGINYSEKMPYRFSTLLAFEPSQSLIVCLQFQKEEDQQPDVFTGLQFSFSQQLYSRFGVATRNEIYYISLGYCFRNNISLELLSQYHFALGISSGLLINCQFNPKK